MIDWSVKRRYMSAWVEALLQRIPIISVPRLIAWHGAKAVPIETTTIIEIPCPRAFLCLVNQMFSLSYIHVAILLLQQLDSCLLLHQLSSP